MGRRSKGTVSSHVVGLVLLATVALHSGVAAADCKGAATAVLDVVETPFSFGVDRGKRAEELSRMSPNFRRAGNASSVSITQGLFVAKLRMGSSYRMSTGEQPDGSYCSEAKNIRLEFGDGTPGTLYVARHFPQGSCAYAAVHFHEMKHVDQHKRMLTYSRAWLRSHFDGWSPAAAGRSSNEARMNLEKLLKEQVAAAYAYAEALYSVNVDLIDTPEEYARVDASCQEWYQDGVDVSTLR
jgi:hypothetical protein